MMNNVIHIRVELVVKHHKCIGNYELVLQKALSQEPSSSHPISKENRFNISQVIIKAKKCYFSIQELKSFCNLTNKPFISFPKFHIVSS
jgi:hypothetical protein